MRPLLLLLLHLLLPASFSMLILHGTRSSRSPLCDWYMHESDIPFALAAPRPSPHPFSQVPCLVDRTFAKGDGGDPIVVFESAAILLHLYLHHGRPGSGGGGGGGGGAPPSPGEYAQALSWVIWANTCLDGICFKENDKGQVLGTSLDRPNRR